MKIKIILISLIFSTAFISNNQKVNLNPKSLQKDIKKIWGSENITMTELNVPDSLYNNLLLDKGKIYQTSDTNNNYGFAYIGRIYSCRSGGCGSDENQDNQTIDEDFEYFDYFIIFNEALMVEKIRIYNYQATHGHEVCGKGWLKQFVGFSGESKLEYGKNIDSISGATISANAITYSVQESSRYLRLLKPILLGINQNIKAEVKY